MNKTIIELGFPIIPSSITIDYESLTEDKRLQMPNVNAMNL